MGKQKYIAIMLDDGAALEKKKIHISLETFNDFILILLHLPVPVVITKDKLIGTDLRDDMMRVEIKFKPCFEQSFS